MARPKNSAETVTITLSTTPMIKAFLEVLVEDGTYGKNVAEAAERLLAERIRKLRGDGDLANRLAKARREEITSS